MKSKPNSYISAHLTHKHTHSPSARPTRPHQVFARQHAFLQWPKDGDLALSHFHWKTAASGYHTCQRGTRGWRRPRCCWQQQLQRLAKLGLHISPGSLAERLRVAARRAAVPKSHGVCYAYSFRLVPPRWCLKSK